MCGSRGPAVIVLAVGLLLAAPAVAAVCRPVRVDTVSFLADALWVAVDGEERQTRLALAGVALPKPDNPDCWRERIYGVALRAVVMEVLMGARSVQLCFTERKELALEVRVLVNDLVWLHDLLADMGLGVRGEALPAGYWCGRQP